MESIEIDLPGHGELSSGKMWVDAETRGVFSVHLPVRRREGRARVAVLSSLMLVLVGCIALVGTKGRGADIATTSADGASEASILARLQGARDFAARAESFQRLGTADQPPRVAGPGSAGQAEWMQSARARAAASERLQMMQMQVD